MSTDLPQWKCHKVVKAAKIVAIDHGARLDLMPHGVVEQSPEWFTKHNPQPGSYYVVYEDGYASVSPAQAFEEGYTAVEDIAPCPEVEDLNITASFKPEILPNGDLSRIRIKQHESLLSLTREQALTLAQEIQRRFAD